MNYQQKIIQLIMKIFTEEGRVTENGLIAFQGLVSGQGENIDISQIGSYVKYALESQDDDCARLACGIITDLASNMGTRLAEYLPDFAPCLHNILRSNTINQKIKLPALHALGDLSLNIGDQFNQYFLAETMTILCSAAQMSVMTQSDVPETVEFLKELR
jgi:importin subunit beta-1